MRVGLDLILVLDPLRLPSRELETAEGILLSLSRSPTWHHGSDWVRGTRGFVGIGYPRASVAGWILLPGTPAVQVGPIQDMIENCNRSWEEASVSSMRTVSGPEMRLP